MFLYRFLGGPASGPWQTTRKMETCQLAVPRRADFGRSDPKRGLLAWKSPPAGNMTTHSCGPIFPRDQYYISSGKGKRIPADDSVWKEYLTARALTSWNSSPCPFGSLPAGGTLCAVHPGKSLPDPDELLRGGRNLVFRIPRISGNRRG